MQTIQRQSVYDRHALSITPILIQLTCNWYKLLDDSYIFIDFHSSNLKENEFIRKQTPSVMS